MIDASNVQVKELNKLGWKSFELQSNYHTYQIEHQQVHFNNGVTFNIPRAFLNIKNLSINNDSILILTNKFNVNSIFNELPAPATAAQVISNTCLLITTHVPEVSVDSVIVRSGIQKIQKKIITPATNISYYISTKDNTISLRPENTVISKSEIYNIEFNQDYVSISNLDGLYLTDRGIYLHLYPKHPNFVQKFNYILNKDNLILFKYNSNFTVVIDFSFNTGSLSFVNINSIKDIPVHSHVYIKQLKDPIVNTSSIKNSFLAKYTTSPLSASNTLDLDNITKNKEYYQNYLVNIPIGNYIKADKPHIAYINSLKNFQTTNYNYYLNPNSKWLNNREYTNIFTGINQLNGYDNIYLNFISNTLEKVFIKDTETTFHYPATAPTVGVPLSAAGLIEEGAISGKNPYTSDRVMMSRKDYRELNVPLLSAIIADNTWLYAWLSAGEDGQSAWMDRFYTGAKYNITDYEYLSYIVNDPLIIDTPSALTFLPNRVYKYFHQGPENIKKYVDQLSFIDSKESAKLLEITDWGSSTLTDKSFYKNDGIITSNTSELSKEYFYLDGKSYALFPATSSLGESRQLYTGLWLKIDNWKEIEGSQIFGNYADGGYGLFNKQNIPTSYITLVDNYHHYLYNFNSNFKIVNEQKLITSTLPINNKPIYIIRTAEQSYWIINSNTLTAGKYDLNNNLLIEIKDLSPLKNISQVDIDDIERIYILDNISKKIIIYDSNTGVILTGLYGLNFNYQRFELTTKLKETYQQNIIFNGFTSERINDRMSKCDLVGVDGIFSVTDNEGNIWHSVGINLYKNKSLYSSVGIIDYITCDSKNNIWIIHDRYFVTKIDSTTNYISFTKKINSYIIESLNNNVQKRFINFISVKENNKEVDYAIIVDNEEKVCYLIKPDGTLYNKINLLTIPSTFLSKRNFVRDNINFTCYGDFTGYQFQRKFNNNNELTWKVKVSQASGYTGISDNSADKVIYLPFSTDVLDEGWHYFSFLFDHQRGRTAAYVDGIKMNEYKFNPFRYIIKQPYKPFTLGAITTDQGLLNDTIGMNDKHKVVGYVSSLHIYKYAFEERDINLLYKSTYINLYKDLVWNIPIGNRNYIEQIDKFFMHKMPGNKSKLFNIKIKNFNATIKQQELIEQAIKLTIDKIKPADTLLNKIKWE